MNVFVVETINRTDDYKHGGRDWERHEISLFKDEDEAYRYALEEALQQEPILLRLISYEDGPETIADIDWICAKHPGMSHLQIMQEIVQPLIEKKGEYIPSPPYEINVYVMDVQ
jgi:hypothetical protein